MSTNRSFASGRFVGSPHAGFALIIVLAMVVLISVAVVAFIFSVQQNGQISQNAVSEQEAEVYSRGATQSIIATLQKEMADGSSMTTLIGSSPTAPVIMPMTNNAAVVPSRSVGLPAADTTYNSSPNSAYAQWVNLVKQSVPKPLYIIPSTYYAGNAGTTKPAVTGINCPASSVLTSTASVDGRMLDAAYWSLPQLIPAWTGTTPLTPLVPDWIYTARNGSNPTTFTTVAAQVLPTTGASGALNPTYIMGRYAYNIYDIGGLLNANVVGYGSATNTDPTTLSTGTPSSASPAPIAQLLVPGYKGSAMSGDLSGLSLNSTLTLSAGATAIASLPANWQNQLPQWRAQGNWATNGTASSGFAYVLSGGEFSGWLKEIFGSFNVDPSYDPANPYATTIPSTSISNYHFTSRQDLINWVTNQWSSLTGGSNLTWTLPYLTQFSYDTDAPSFYPVPAATRPKDAVAVTAGGNDATTFTDSSSATGDAAINPPYTSVVDANGLPVVKRRFPLSALALVSSYYPGNEPPTAAVNPALAQQFLYDFGLYWVAGQGWVYSDWEAAGGVTGTPSTKIKLLRDVPNTRSANFFELLKSAIVAGSLGKQYGNLYDFGGTGVTTENTVQQGRYGSIDCQVIQIGANIISQAAGHYFPTDIQFTYNGTVYHFYGDKDLPYLYRTRLVQYPVEDYANMYDPDAGAATQLDAAAVQVELWNPHAPNRITPPPVSTYPKAFRVVPYMASGYTQIFNVSAGPQPKNGKWGSASQYTYSTPSQSGDYSSMGGPLCTSSTVGYVGMSLTNPTCYIQVPALTPAGASAPLGTPDLTSFREPCPLVAGSLPSGSAGNCTATPLFTPPVTQAQGTAINSAGTAYAGVSMATTGNVSKAQGNTSYPALYPGGSPAPGVGFGFVLGFFCVGPYNASTGVTDLAFTSPAVNPILQMTAPMSLYLQYEDANNNWHTYDVIDSAMAPGSTSNLPAVIGPYGIRYTDTGTRFDPRTNRWGLIWDNRHGFNLSSTSPNASGYADYMGGMGPSPGSAGGDNFQVGITGTPTTNFQGSWDAIGGSGSFSGRGMVGINASNPVAGSHFYPSGPIISYVVNPSFPTLGTPTSTPGWFNSFKPDNSTIGTPAAGGIQFTGTDSHFPLFRGFVQTNQPGTKIATIKPVTYSATATGSQPSNDQGSGIWVDTFGTQPTAYADPDGVIRLADGGYANSGGDGLPELMVSSSLDGTSTTTLTTGTPQQMDTTSITYASTFDNRPVVINRPFQSVAELGYAFRGMPWRTLDFASPQSGDAALLDVFSTYGPDPWSYASSTYNTANTSISATTYSNTSALVMGRVSLNTQQQPVLAALLKGTLVTAPGASTSAISSATTITDAPAAAIAQALAEWTHIDSSSTTTDLANQGPLRNRSELVGKYVTQSAVPAAGTDLAMYSGFSGSPTLTSTLATVQAKAAAIKSQRESVVRALADVTTTRTWNLLIDLAVQTGKLAPTATSLQNFIVTGERHVWVSVAIDRVTGKVINMQVEPVRL